MFKKSMTKISHMIIMKESGIIISRQNIIWVIKGEYSTYEKKA
jgi:hypothetical protein